jgi:hypothetical protein
MENRRIMKAVRSGNEFKRDWFLAEKFIRTGGINREVGNEMQAELLQSWLQNRKG